MDVILYVLGILLMLAGILGCLLPVLPGPPLNYLGLVLLHFSSKVDVGWAWLAVFALFVIVAQVIDYILPILGMKKFGATKKGMWGAAIGALVGLVFGPIGAFVGLAVGAIVGELIAGKKTGHAMKAGAVTVIANIVGSGLKLCLSFAITIVFIIYFFKAM